MEINDTYCVIGFDWSGWLKDQEYDIKYQSYTFTVQRETLPQDGTCLSNQIITKTEPDKTTPAHQAALLFLSEISWLFSIAIFETEHGGGSTPIKYNTRFVGIKSPRLTIDLNSYTELHPNHDQALSLLYYKDALSSNNIFFSFLSLFKILEIKLDGKQRERWLEEYFSTHPISFGHSLPKTPAELQTYLYKSCRCAIAHAGRGTVVWPNDFNDIQRINIAYSILKQAVDYYMVSDLSIAAKIH